MQHATVHATERALERYGIVASEGDWQQAMLDITNTLLGLTARAIMLRRFDDGAETWVVRLAGCPVIAVYQPRLALFRTVLESGISMQRYYRRSA